ncbi:MAG: ABC transporter permease [bacterium]|nr:ABC transporter permease [bacterium]
MIRFAAVVRKEVTQLIRDRTTLGIVLVIPAIQILLFGYAINTEVKNLPTVVYDAANCRESRNLVQTFVNSQYFEVREYAGSVDEVRNEIARGRAQVGILFPPDFRRNIKAGREATIQVVFDASDPMTAGSAVAAANAISLYYNIELTSSRLGEGPYIPFEVHTRAWYNPDMVTSNFMVPGIIGVMMLMITMMLTAMAVVRERERGTMEQLLVSPVKRLELLLGKVVPYLLLGYVDISIAILIGRYVFDVPIAGSLWLLYGLTFIFFFSTLGLGLLVSTIAKTQQQAMQMSFFIFLPSILLSGFMFPIAAMPEWIQPISWFIPLTYYLKISRGIILKGIGIEHLWQPTLVLAIMGVIILGLATFRMSRRLE